MQLLKPDLEKHPCRIVLFPVKSSTGHKSKSIWSRATSRGHCQWRLTVAKRVLRVEPLGWDY